MTFSKKRVRVISLSNLYFYGEYLISKNFFAPQALSELMRNFDRKIFSRKFYLCSLGILALALPLSNFLMSVAQFLLVASFFLAGNYAAQLRKFWDHKPAVAFTSLYLLHFLGVIYSEDVSYALHDLRISIPLFVIPFVVGTMPSLTKKEFLLMLRIFVFAVFVGTLVSAALHFEIIQSDKPLYRNSIFISHIRFSLMICFSFFILIQFLLKKEKPVLYFILCVWFVISLFMLKAMSGIVIFFICLPLLFIYFLRKIENVFLRKALIAAALVVIILPTLYLGKQVYDFYPRKIGVSALDKYSAHGEKYFHDLESHQLENGNRVRTFIAWNELENSWNLRSDLKFRGTDKNGNELSNTLLRYMTSKGLRKDAEGVAAMTNADISAVENGVANARYLSHGALDHRIYEIIWEVHHYFHGYNPQGHSVAQRLEFWRVGLRIFFKNPLIGVGTGDIKSAFERQYEEMQSPLDPAYRVLSHNQYLTMLISFGILGFLWFCGVILFCSISSKPHDNFLFIIFLFIFLLSMLNEDTLETQAGVTFVTFFFSLLLFSNHEKESPL